ncbi:MAG: hypothetical protein E5Y79_16105 [Mesorhizobium sp.]|uniref:hypothetical protein n=2 Tax=Mesorhizobium sp. TaxID=1871066 RepID=UPI001224B81E|nr:hypothetical protein [Mesorhizobium sp.]TIL59258.1 MAG: hypothetical protein E5Y79_16105 [Mesorhizobium sp.]
MARKPIVQRIELDGGDAIKNQLKALGDAGEKAFKAINTATIKADFAKFGASLKTAGSDLATFGRRAALLGAGLAAAFGGAGAAVLELASSAGEAADSAGKAARSAGVTTQAYTELAFAAKMSNVEQGEFDASMARLNKTIGAAAQGTKTAVGLFQKLGVSLRDSTGNLRTGDAILLDVAEAFSKLPDGALKSALAIQLFGKSGARLLPFLNEGKRGLIDLGAEARALGITFTDAQAKIGDNLGDALDGVSAAARGVKLQLGLIFAPAITQAATALVGRIKELRPAIQAFAQDIANKALPVMLDFVNALTGNDASVQNRWVLDWRDDAIAFGQSMQSAFTIVIGVLNEFRAVLDNVAGAVNSVFGTNLSGDAIGLVLLVGHMTGAFRALYSTIILVKDGLILLRSAFLFLTPWGRIILAVAAALGVLKVGLGLVQNKQFDAASATSAHQKALADLNAAIAGVKNGVPGAEGALKRLGQAHLDAAKTAIADAQAQVAHQQAVLDAVKLSADQSALGPMEKRLGVDIDPAMEALVKANIQLAQRMRELQDIQNTIDGKAVGNIIDLRTDAAAGAAAIKDVGAAAADTAGKVEALGKTIEVFRGGGDKGITKQTFDVVDGVARAVADSKKAVDDLDAATQDAGESIDTGITNSIKQIAPAAQEAAAGFNSALGGLDAGAAQQAAEAIVAPFGTLPGKLSAILGGMRALLQGGFTSLAGIVNSLASQIQAAITRILSALREAAAQAKALRAQAASSSSSSSGGGSQGGFAAGGDVRGAGTGTSDSILAWLSNGEFVARARAVAYYGPGLFHALNNMALPKDFLKSLRGFNFGGMVDSVNRGFAIPRLATGGMIGDIAPASPFGSKRTVNVKLNYGVSRDEVIDLVGQVDAVDQLYRASIKHSLTSTGRWPRRL